MGWTKKKKKNISSHSYREIAKRDASYFIKRDLGSRGLYGVMSIITSGGPFLYEWMARYPSTSFHRITYRLLVFICSLGLFHERLKFIKTRLLFHFILFSSIQKFPNLLIDAIGRVLLDPMRSSRNQAKSEFFCPSVIVKRQKTKGKKKLILFFSHISDDTHTQCNDEHILGGMVSHGDVEEFIFCSPDEQRRHADHFARFAHRIGIDHWAVVVDRTGQVAFVERRRKCDISYIYIYSNDDKAFNLIRYVWNLPNAERWRPAFSRKAIRPDSVWQKRGTREQKKGVCCVVRAGHNE